MIRLIVAAGLFLAPAEGKKAAPAQEFSSGPERVLLMELYTSEGCSSCPPADRKLSAYRSSPLLWKAVVPVGLHVDYWDHLGWPDPLASAAHSRRQSGYAAHWKRRRVYTPGWVLGGEEWSDWSGAPETDSQKTGKLAVRAEQGALRVEFYPADDAQEIWTVHAALLGFGIVTSVPAGENRGKKLRHDFSALALQSRTLAKGKGGVLKADMPAFPEPALKNEGLGLAVWVTRGSDPTPVQAAGGYLR